MCLRLIFRQWHLSALFPTCAFWRSWNSSIGGWQGDCMGSCQGCLFQFISLHFISLLFFQYIFCQTPRQAFVICQWSERKPCSQVAHCLGGRQTDKQSAPEQCAKRPSLGAGRGCQGKEVLTRSEPSGHGAVWRNFREGLQRTAKRKKKKQQACRKVSMWLQILGWPKHLFGFHKMLWEKPEQTFWPIQYLKMYFNFSFFFFFRLWESSLRHVDFL